MSLDPNGAPAGCYYQAGATAYLIDPAGTYSLAGAGASAPTTDPAGTYSGAGASAPTLVAAGAYIPVTGATSSAAEIVDPAGTYSAAGASAPSTDPAGTHSGAGASAPTLAAAGTSIPATGATSSAAEIVDPAGTYSAGGASAPATDPAGTYSGAGASAPTLAAAGTSIPATGATSSAAEIVDLAASAATADQAPASSDLVASPDTIDPHGAPAGYYYQAGATAYIEDPAGTFSLAGATMPTADPGGTYSGAGASAATTDPAGTYSSPYALSCLFIDGRNTTPDNAVLPFTSVTAVENYFGATSPEASLAKEFFAGYGGTSATMLFTRYGRYRRPHLLGANISNLTPKQLQSISGSLAITFQGYNYSGPINLSGVGSFKAAAEAIKTALNSHLQVAAVTTGSSIASASVSFTASANGLFLQVTSVSGAIYPGARISGNGVVAGDQIVTQLSGTPGGVGVYSLFQGTGQISSETMTETYGMLTVGAVTSGTVAVGQEVTGVGVLPKTAIEDNLSGSGPGSTWLVNNPQTVGGVAGETLKTTAPPLSVILDWGNKPIIGATENNDFFDVSPNLNFPYDTVPSSLSYMSGTAAAMLGLTQASGAIDLSPGGQNPTACRVHEQPGSEREQPVRFVSDDPWASGGGPKITGQSGGLGSVD